MPISRKATNRLRRKFTGRTSRTSSTTATLSKAQKEADLAVTTVRSELLPSQVSRVAPNAKLVAAEGSAFVVKGSSQIHFGTGPAGNLRTSKSSSKSFLLDTTRHETAHLLGVGHPATFAAASPGSRGSVSAGSLLGSNREIQSSVNLQSNTSLRSHRIFTRLVREKERNTRILDKLKGRISNK